MDCVCALHDGGGGGNWWLLLCRYGYDTPLATMARLRAQAARSRARTAENKAAKIA